jgi:hypothetical protein
MAVSRRGPVNEFDAACYELEETTRLLHCHCVGADLDKIIDYVKRAKANLDYIKYLVDERKFQAKNGS